MNILLFILFAEKRLLKQKEKHLPEHTIVFFIIIILLFLMVLAPMQIFYLVIISVHKFCVCIYFTFYIIYYVVSLKLVFPRSNNTQIHSLLAFSVFNFFK